MSLFLFSPGPRPSLLPKIVIETVLRHRLLSTIHRPPSTILSSTDSRLLPIVSHLLFTITVYGPLSTPLHHFCLLSPFTVYRLSWPYSLSPPLFLLSPPFCRHNCFCLPSCFLSAQLFCRPRLFLSARPLLLASLFLFTVIVYYPCSPFTVLFRQVSHMTFCLNTPNRLAYISTRSRNLTKYTIQFRKLMVYTQG